MKATFNQEVCSVSSNHVSMSHSHLYSYRLINETSSKNGGISKMTKAQRDAEEQARQDELEGRVEALMAQGAMSWVWPGTGEDGDVLPRNCFFTGLPVPKKQHANAYKTRWTPLPGCANLRHKKRQRAGMQRSGARVA